MCCQLPSRCCLLVGAVKNYPGTEGGRECDIECLHDDSVHNVKPTQVNRAEIVYWVEVNSLARPVIC